MTTVSALYAKQHRADMRSHAMEARIRIHPTQTWLASFTEEHHPSPSRQIERDEQAAQLRAALEKLPARQAETLHLVFYQDLSISEAAVIMGVSLGSARTHYERGKTRLRELLSHSSDR